MGRLARSSPKFLPRANPTCDHRLPGLAAAADMRDLRITRGYQRYRRAVAGRLVSPPASVTVGCCPLVWLLGWLLPIRAAGSPTGSRSPSILVGRADQRTDVGPGRSLLRLLEVGVGDEIADDLSVVVDPPRSSDSARGYGVLWSIVADDLVHPSAGLRPCLGYKGCGQLMLVGHLFVLLAQRLVHEPGVDSFSRSGMHSR